MVAMMHWLLFKPIWDRIHQLTAFVGGRRLIAYPLGLLLIEIRSRDDALGGLCAAAWDDSDQPHPIML